MKKKEKKILCSKKALKKSSKKKFQKIHQTPRRGALPEKTYPENWIISEQYDSMYTVKTDWNHSVLIHFNQIDVTTMLKYVYNTKKLSILTKLMVFLLLSIMQNNCFLKSLFIIPFIQE